MDVAERFAAALDADDFAGAARLLAPDCTYRAAGRTLAGPDAVLASYRAPSESARRRFDSVRCESRVERLGPALWAVWFTDHVTHRGRSHTYRCRQLVRVNALGRIAAVERGELPGERERLDAFVGEAGG